MSGRVERASAVNIYAVCSDGERAEERVSIELNCRTFFVGQHASELHQFSCPLSTSICSSVAHFPRFRASRRLLGNCTAGNSDLVNNSSVISGLAVSQA